MTTVSHRFDPAPATVDQPVRLALCSFAVPEHAGQGERMQAELALRYLQQQLARLGADVCLVPPLCADGPPASAEEVDGLVLFPAFCPSLAALDEVLAGTARPGLVLALNTGFEDDGELAASYGNPLAALPAQVLATLASEVHDHGCVQTWIAGTLFDVRVWFDAATWLCALQTSLSLSRRRLPVQPRRASAHAQYASA